MNLTRWSARLPGTQRRGAVPAARGKTVGAAAPAGGTKGGSAAPADPPPPPRAGGADRTDTLAQAQDQALCAAGGASGTLAGVLSQLPALIAVTTGPAHRVSYVNDAYADVFGPRVTGAPAREALPELDELGLLPLMDQVHRSGRPRTVKARRVSRSDATSLTRQGYFTFTCTPVHPDDPDPERRGVLVFAADVTDQVQSAERLRESERRLHETAVTLQRSLLPQQLEQPDDLRLAATYQPGGTDAAVGGDWYDVITLGGGRTALVIGDVMGRGVRAAAVMGQLRTAVRAYARLDLPPHEVIQLLDGLASEIDATQIATCVYAVHDPSEGRLSYASAGHLPILIRDPDGTVQRTDEPTGPPLGTGGWTHTSATVPFGPGCTAVLYTDGLIERRGEDIEEGVSTLMRALSGATGAPQVICDRLMRALGVTAQHDDDVAVLVLQYPDHTGHPDGEVFRNASLELLGGIEAAPRARAFASGVLASWRFPVELRDLGVLAASELVANSLKHGTPPMRLRLRRTDRRLVIEVTDGDEHLPRRQRAEPADEAGRGISIIATIASSWGSRRTPGGGKAVWCEFTLPG
ncbi:SpoIIE family protein phosphatase [Streptomyces cocklensis]|uniref:Histidine kinase-like ATPase domain-containing protein n=1 Tax=Actinacidiphila cocklensis TaxID=887465 RepID=A0A9W4E129_9ACTN|nr:SpoIIE family protein phosphatase [Actinacidiphila cocklensis]MDD1064025.1 SpoIIE family protein phosphatase [Actinacidiphila cocklensis]WSX77732.1 SpoIIE family protein phosphatase [Streptomyces sp. NBC_00899]CAG6399504.1 Histidine kinase-like ATPase domain-containing protein [Actinacidiphila cocklensis]